MFVQEIILRVVDLPAFERNCSKKWNFLRAEAKFTTAWLFS